jgi:uncharacterized protein YecT (DUF1311 family)
MRFMPLAAAFSVMTLCAPIRAAEPAIDCNTATSTPEMNACAEKQYNAADAKLNAAYKALMGRVHKTTNAKPYDAKSAEEALQASQRSWIAFRDAECKGFEPMAWGGGTITTLQVLGCMTSLTEARVKMLNEHFSVQ